MKEFHKTRFVTVNVVKDWLNSIRDFLGLEQKSYNSIVEDTVATMMTEIRQNGTIAWYRMNVDRTFEKTLQITIYGQYEGESDGMGN